MNHLIADRLQKHTRSVEFTTADLQTIYGVLMDRYEHLDTILRSVPAPTDKDAVAMEKSEVEGVIRRMSS